MKNTAASRQPVASFALPPSAPAAVLDAQAAFDRMGDRWGELQGELRESRDALKQAQAADRDALKNALAEGKEAPKQHDRHEQAAVARRERLEAELAAASQAVDEAGNALAHAVGECRDEWADALAEAGEAAHTRATAALAELQAAVADVGNARRAVEWLADFDVGEAIAGQTQQFAGGAVRVDMGMGMQHEQPAARLLQIVGDALTPAEPSVPRSHVVVDSAR